MRKVRSKLFIILFIMFLGIVPLSIKAAGPNINIHYKFIDIYDNNKVLDEKDVVSQGTSFYNDPSVLDGIARNGYQKTEDVDTTLNFHYFDNTTTSSKYNKKYGLECYTTAYEEVNSNQYYSFYILDNNNTRRYYKTSFTWYLDNFYTNTIDYKFFDPREYGADYTPSDGDSLNITCLYRIESINLNNSIPTAPSVDGHYFAGWFNDKLQRRNSVYFNSTSISEINNKLKNLDKNLYATYRSNDETICKRGKTIHTETCDRDSGGCFDAGYYEGGSKDTTTISYGNIGQSGQLNAGDIFTCDVNNDGYYDEEKERFYYVSSYFNTATKEFENDKSVLVYYSNTTPMGTTKSSNDYFHFTHSDNYMYPDTNYMYCYQTYNSQACNSLVFPSNQGDGYGYVGSAFPATWQTYFVSTNRKIINENGTNPYSAYGDRYSTAITEFSSNSRPLSIREVGAACGKTFSAGSTQNGDLNSCNFLLENTAYGSNSVTADSYWLETVYGGYSAYSFKVWGVDAAASTATGYNVSDTTTLHGARPAIEMYNSNIEIDFDDDTRNVTIEGGSQTSVAYNSEYTLPAVPAKADEDVDVTLIYTSDNQTTQTAYTKQYVPNGWLVNGNGYENERFAAGDKITLLDDITITPDYVEVRTDTEFIFPQIPAIETYTASNVTFKYHDNETADANKDITVTSNINKWIGEVTSYNPGDTFDRNKTMTFKADYTYSDGALENPTRDGYVFQGWFDAAEDGNRIDKHSLKSNMTLHAQWKQNESGIKCKRPYQTNPAYYLYIENGDKLYGNIGTSDKLNYGDIFFCDVNGDGYYVGNEAFHYVSDYYNTETKEFEDDTAVLINPEALGWTYYGGTIGQYTYRLYPDALAAKLPNWSNVSLKHSERQLLTNKNNSLVTDSYGNRYSLPKYDYSGHTTRPLTYQELAESCGITDSYDRQVSHAIDHEVGTDFSQCDYAFIARGFHGGGSGNNVWLETQHSNSGDYLIMDGSLKTVSYLKSGQYIDDAYLMSAIHAKAAIEVPKEQLQKYTNDYQHTITVEGKETLGVSHGYGYTLPTNDIAVEDDGTATVTYVYQDGQREDEAYVYYRDHQPRGWTDGTNTYDNNAVVFVIKDLTLRPNYYYRNSGFNMPNPYRSGYRFDGWYTEPEGGEKITSTEDLVDRTLYAHWIAVTDFYNYDYSWQQVDVGTEITLDEDDGGYNDFEDYFDFTLDYNYEDAPSADYINITSEGEFDHWEINGITYNPGDTYVINSSTRLESVYRAVTDPETLPEEPIREGYKFIGWYTKAEGGKLIDLETIDQETYWNMNNHILYAHWVEFDPETQVMVNWDGNYKAYPKGAVVDLDIDENKYYDEHIANVIFRMQKTAYTDPTVEIKEKYTRDHYLINGEEHISTGTYTFNEDTTLKSVYTSEVIYPDVPTYDYEGFEGFYTESDYRDGDEVTSLEGIYEDTEYYAHWHTEYVSVYTDGNLYTEYQEKRLDSLPWISKDSGNYYFNFDYDVAGNDDFATKSLANMYYYYNLEYYMIDNVRYETYEKYNYQDDTYIEGVYTQNGYFSSPYYSFYDDNFDIGRQREAAEAGHYYYLEGWYTGKNGTGDKIDLSNIDHSLITSDASDSNVGQTLYANWILDPTVNVTIDDNEPYEYEAGSNLLIPEEKEVSTEKADDTFNVTFDYNDGTDRTMTEEVGRSYSFSYYKVDGKGNYQRNDIYNFYKDTTIESVYNISYDYPEVPTLDVPKFKGFYTKPSGGYKVESFYDINVTGPITLYAQYYTGMVHVNFDGEEYDVEAGTAITLEEKDPFNKSITLNFDYNNGYHPKKQAHIITTYNTDSYQVETDNNSYWHSPNDVYICGEDSKITTNYSTESSNDFEGYSDNEWDMGLQYTNNSDITFRLDHWESNINPNGGDCGKDCGGEIGMSPGPNIDQEYGSGTKNNPRPGEGNDDEMYYVDFWSIMDNPEPYEDATLYASWDTAWVNVEYYDTLEDSYWSSTSYQSGNYIDWIPDYQKDGYFFDGWYSDRTNWTGKLTENTKAIKDITYYGRWIEDTRDDPDNQCMIVNQDGTTQTVAKGDTYPLGTNNITREDEEVAEVTFEYEDGETPADIDYVMKSFTPNGWLVNNQHFDNDEEITCDSDVCFIIPDYTEELISPTFPEPTRENYVLKGWYNFPEGGTKYTEYTGTYDMTFYAQWGLAKPTDFELDEDEIYLMFGDTYQLGVTFIPEGTEDNLVFEGYDPEALSITSDGLITGLAPGTYTVDVSLESDPTVTKTINVTVLDNELVSETLTVATKEIARIIIGEEPKTKIEDFLSKIDNPVEYIQIYDKDDTLIEDYDTMLTTGMKVKLVVNDHEYDEAIVIIRGDIDEDGQVQPADNLILKDHLLKKSYITGYRLYAADVDEEEGVLIENAIKPSDNNKLMNYLLKKSSTLNN